jgi:hypothetical protein
MDTSDNPEESGVNQVPAPAVPDTPTPIPPKELPRHRSRRLWFVLATVAAVVIVIILVLLTRKTEAPGKSATMTTSSNTAAASSATLPAGTNNASLSSDVNNIQGSMNQENSDQTTATSTLNDSQQEITVPTN